MFCFLIGGRIRAEPRRKRGRARAACDTFCTAVTTFSEADAAPSAAADPEEAATAHFW